ncbi:hypothetical protein [Propioniciclava flava]|uniref:Pyridoxamine 5'-phosphate oxidase putative domain-containing protein n=1 Tax=Propioniciclava flava TaxID=2072026 RepID=A0A4Q2EE61_9ACTN|nr:hypothetical protein [Propioniciclava flava]RXW31870.1 hypothetical protein C1706_10010 [Propioniciclava flava]
MRLADADRVNVTTFDAAGQGTTSTNFVVGMDEDRIGLWTTESGPWTQRLSLSAVVSLHAATPSGKDLREEPVLEGKAVLVTEGEEYEAVRAATEAKYGLAMKVAQVADWAWELGGKGTPDGVVVISIVG